MIAQVLQTVLGLLLLPTSPESGVASLVTSRMEDRVVKILDFDERKLGNFESMPRGWRPIYGPGFPRFLEAKFDLEVGHDAPPSFRLPVSGGNVGAYYVAKDINVHPGCEYRVTGWMRTENLVHSSAKLSAYYVDHALNKIAESERSCPEVGSEGGGSNHRRDACATGGSPWRRMIIDLPGGFEKARWIGLSCKVERSEESGLKSQNAETSKNQNVGREACATRPIPYHDVHGAVWVDDISVVRLPKVTLQAVAVGNIVAHDTPLECIARVADLDGRDIQATLEVLDVDGRCLERRKIDPVRIDERGHTTRIGELPAGFYVARLAVSMGSEVIEDRSVTMIKLNGDLPAVQHDEAGLGVMLDGSWSSAPSLVCRLVQALSVRHVSLPLWQNSTGANSILRGDKPLDRILDEFATRGIGVRGVLSQLPQELRNQVDRATSIFDVLAAPVDKWRAYVAFPMTHYAARVQEWQIGDGVISESAEVSQVYKALSAFCAETKPLINPARIALAWPMDRVLSPKVLATDILALYAPPHLTAARMIDYLESFAKAAGERTVVLLPPERETTPHAAYLSEWARRLIVARAAGANLVSTPQPWKVVGDAGDSRVILEERFLIERTVAQALDGLSSAGPLWVDDDVEAHLFTNPSTGQGALSLWMRAEDAPTRDVVIELGPEARAIDLLANVSELTSVGQGRRIGVGSAPIIIAPVDARRLQTLASLDIDSPGLQADIQGQKRSLVFSNNDLNRLIGRLKLIPPEGWRIAPGDAPVDLRPGESTRFDVTIFVPSNAAAGAYTLSGRLSIDGVKPETRMMRTPLQVGAAGLDVGVFTHVSGGVLHVVQRVTNNTERRLQLRSSLTCPDRLSQTRLIPQLPPGETAVREYVITEPQSLKGKFLRASIEEIGGNLRIHQVTKCD